MHTKAVAHQFSHEGVQCNTVCIHYATAGARQAPLAFSSNKENEDEQENEEHEEDLHDECAVGCDVVEVLEKGPLGPFHMGQCVVHVLINSVLRSNEHSRGNSTLSSFSGHLLINSVLRSSTRHQRVGFSFWPCPDGLPLSIPGYSTSIGHFSPQCSQSYLKQGGYHKQVAGSPCLNREGRTGRPPGMTDADSLPE